MKCKVTDKLNDFDDSTGANANNQTACPAAALRPTRILNLPVLAFAAIGPLLMAWL